MNNYQKEKNELLKNLIKEHPSMKVLYINKSNCDGCNITIDNIDSKGVCKKCGYKNRWCGEKKISELTESEKKQINLIKQQPNEIILDIEEKYLIEEIIKKLKEKQWTSKIYSTGSKGYHVSILFENLADKELKLRNRIRKNIINQFEYADIKLAKENQWVAMPWAKHFKTGNVKTFYDTLNYSKNYIDDEIIEYCKEDLKESELIKIENSKIESDYVNKDPCLNYFLNNVVANGDRNNIIFKNLAIGLVNSGLSREQILPYAEKIVENCPGKTLGEFMGWVDKALSGHLTDYNKQELIAWAVSKGIKPFYKISSDDNIYEFMDIKQLWDNLWNYKISNQPVWKDMCFYNMLGTVIQEKEKDYRIHLIFTAPSGSGKDEGINFVRDILDSLQLNTKAPITVTDRTLIGSVNQSKIEYNVKWGLSEDEQEKKGKQYQNPVEEGWLANTDWIACAEAEFIFKPGIHNRNIQAIFRQTMDKAKKVEKGVTGYDIPIETNTSLVFTTYKMDNILQTILHNGLFQRSLFYKMDLTEEGHNLILDHIINQRFANDINSEKVYKKVRMILLKKLRLMKEWYKENRNNFIYDDEISIYIKKHWRTIQNKYSILSFNDKKILLSQVRRLTDILMRLTILKACYLQQTHITIDMVRECFKIIEHCLDGLKFLILSDDTSNKNLFVALSLLKDGSITKGVYHKKMQELCDIPTRQRRVDLLERLCNLEYVTIFKDGKKEYIALTEKGRKYFEGNN